MLRGYVGNDVIELHAFVFLKHLLQRELDAKLCKGIHVTLGAEHLAVHQRAIAIEKQTFYRHHIASFFSQGEHCNLVARECDPQTRQD